MTQPATSGYGKVEWERLPMLLNASYICMLRASCINQMYIVYIFLKKGQEMYVGV